MIKFKSRNRSYCINLFIICNITVVAMDEGRESTLKKPEKSTGFLVASFTNFVSNNDLAYLKKSHYPSTMYAQ